MCVSVSIQTHTQSPTFSKFFFFFLNKIAFMSELAVGVCLPGAGFLALQNPTHCCSLGFLPDFPPSFLLSLLQTQVNKLYFVT